MRNIGISEKNTKYKTLREKVEHLFAQAIRVATTDFFCIICEGDIKRKTRYYYAGRNMKAHELCVKEAIGQYAIADGSRCSV